MTPAAWSWFPQALERFLSQPAFVEDARVFGQIPIDALDRALALVRDTPGFLGRARIIELLVGALGDAKQGESLANVLVNFARLRQDLSIPPKVFLREVISKVPKSLEQLDEPLREAVQGRLPKALEPVPCVDRQVKVDALVRRTGSHLDDLSMTCDLRPVFNDDRTQVEGLVPLTTLRLVTHLAGTFEPSVLEISVTEKELARLCDEVDRAKRKLVALKAFVKSHDDIALPESRMTVLEDSEEQ